MNNTTAEEQRLAFLEARDGIDGAVEFAQRTMRQYRGAVLRSRKRGYSNAGPGTARISHASLPEYRRGFIESYMVLKRYVLKHSYLQYGMADVHYPGNA